MHLSRKLPKASAQQAPHGLMPLCQIAISPSVCLATCLSRPGPVSHLWSVASVAALDTLSQLGIPPEAPQPCSLIYNHLQ